MYAIGIDVGTTNCKVCLYRIADLELINKQSFITPKTITESGSDFNIHALWEGILTALSLTARAVKDAENIATISVASVGEAGVLLDKEDAIIGPVMTWYDTRTQPQLEKVTSRIGEERLYEITGIPAHSNYSLNKILWLMENCKKYRPAKWLCLAEYIAFRLSGVKKAEYSLASRTLAFDINAGSWSEEICQAMALPPELFSPLVTAGEPTGYLLPELSQATGLEAQVKISIAGHDHMCGAVAAGVGNEDRILNSTGTTEGLLVIAKKPSVTPDYYRARLSNGRHSQQGAYTLYASLPSAGYVIEWFCKLLGLTAVDFNEMTNQLFHAGAAEKPEACFIIPHLRGSGPPERTNFARALIYGINDRTDAQILLTALYQGLCFELRLLLETCESLAGRRWDALLVIGAACQNPHWLQLKATVLNREIVACKLPEAVSRGAAITGARGAGHEPESGLPGEDALVRYQPESRAAQAFNQLYERLYKPLYTAKIAIETLNRTEK